jgi:hypothetical protein
VSVSAEPTFTIGASTTLVRAPIDAGSVGVPFEVVGDGARFLLLMPVRQAPPPITVVLNWSAQLKPH